MNRSIVCGTYEEFLVGYEIKNCASKNGVCEVDDTVQTYEMERTIATHSHKGSIRCVAAKKHYLASGGADECICLYDMRSNLESGKLFHHTDIVSCMSFTPDGSHLMTGSKDGSIAMLRCGSWQMEKHFKSCHKGLPVEALAIHSTGKLALSTGGDGVLRTWNLVKGRQAYATNMATRWKADAKNMTIVEWSPEGDKYLVAGHNNIDVYSIETAGVVNHIEFKLKKVTSVAFITNEVVSIGFEDGIIKLYNLKKDKFKMELAAHSARVKCLVFDSEDEDRNNLLISASSDGEVKLWNVQKNKMKMVGKTECKARILCMTVMKRTEVKRKKEKEEDEVIVPDKKTRSEEFFIMGKGRVSVEYEEEEKKTKRKQKRKVKMEEENTKTPVQVEKRKKQKVEKENRVQEKKKAKKNSGWEEHSILENTEEKEIGKKRKSEKKRKNQEPVTDTAEKKKKKKMNVS